MKILHLFGPVNLPHDPDTEGCSGVVRNTLQLAAVQAHQGHEVVVCAPSSRPSIRRWKGVKIVGLSAKSWAQVKIGGHSFDFRQPLANVLYTWTHQFDVVHTHKEDYVRFLKSRIRIVHIDSDPLHGQLSASVRSANLQLLNHEAHALIAISHFIKSRLQQSYPFSIPVSVIRNGVDSHQFDSAHLADQRALLRTQWKISSHREVAFLFCGAWVEEKGLRELSHAYLALLAETPQAHLILIGSEMLWSENNTSVEYASSVRKLLAQSPRPSQVHYIGSIGHDTLPGYYAACDVVVVPSTYQEPSSLTVFEAMASKRPVIASNVGGIPELLDRCGILIPPRSQEDLKKAMQYLVQRPDVRQTHGEMGRQHILQHSWEAMAQQVAHVYETTLRTRLRRQP